MIRTNAGIYWVRDSIPAVTKILCHEWYAKELLKRGITEEEILARPDAMPTIRKKPYNNMFAEYVDHMLPEFRPYYDEHSKGHAFGYARALTDRTTHSLRKGEMRRFRDWPEWGPVRRMVLNAIETGRPIDTMTRYAAHEQLVKKMVRGRPGVYLNISCERKEWCYLGESECVSARMDGHRNGDFFLIRVYVVSNKADAKNLQDSLYRHLARHDADTGGQIIKLKRIPNGSVGCWGATRLTDGMDPLSYFDNVVDTHYSEWCRAKAGTTKI